MYKTTPICEIGDNQHHYLREEFKRNKESGDFDKWLERAKAGLRFETVHAMQRVNQTYEESLIDMYRYRRGMEL